MGYAATKGVFILNYPDWRILFIVQTDASDKKLNAVISKNDKPIALF